MKRLLTLMLTAALSLPVWALDEAGQARLHAVQTRWAEIQYQLPEAQREAALEKLAAESAAFTREQPQAAEAWVWHGIVTSSYVAGKSQVFHSSGGYQGQERHNTVKKINDIEAQMSRNWWTRKSEEGGATALSTRATPLSTPKPPVKPVIASVRMGVGLEDPPPGVDLLDGFEFATAPPPGSARGCRRRRTRLVQPGPAAIAVNTRRTYVYEPTW